MPSYEWDERKNESNRHKHGIGFELAVEVFDDPMARSAHDRVVDGEERWQTIGMVRGVMLLLVAHTVREEDGAELVRLISARKATRGEWRVYEEGE
ncbi:BrnT family toxin [Silvibacterium sp.]|uniref:BrnT family toxin n=1 Tax=Silvibacterium sp. TaxID=1964179 RepID=UPI0039E2DD9D